MAEEKAQSPMALDRLPEAGPAAFFAEIFRGCSGWLEIRLIPSRRSAFFPLPGGVDRAARFAGNWSGKEHVFFSVYPRSRQGRRDASAVRQAQLLYADLDPDHFGGGAEEIDARLAAFSPAPSVVVASGGGRHAYWLLSHPLDALPGDGHRQVQDCLWGIADALGVPQAKNAVHDLARVLRVPGTLNIKPAYGRGTPCEVVLWEPSRRYPPSAFREFALRGRSRPGRAGEGGNAVRFAGGPADPEAVLARLRPPAEILKLIREGVPVGQRSEADQRVITWLLKAGASPDEIRAVFANPRWRIGDKYREPGMGDRYLRLSIGNALAWLRQRPEQSAARRNAGRLPGRVAVPAGWDGRVVAVAADWAAAREAYAAGKAVVVAFEDGTVPPEAAELLRSAQALEAAGEGPARDRLEWLLTLLQVEPEPAEAKPRDRWCPVCQKCFELPPGAEEKCPECGGEVTELSF